MSSYLVVGGGFLGSHLADQLASQGHHVTIYSRSFNEWLLEDDRSGGGKITLVHGVVPPGEGLEELIENCDAIFYMAGVSSPASARDDPGGSITSFVVPAASVLDLMRRTHTRRVVVASSGGTVYGATTQMPTREDDPTDPISLHGHNSLTVERYATFFQRHHGFEPVILRYSNPYGPGQLMRRGQGVIAAWCQRLIDGEEIVLYGNAATRRDFIYVTDAAAATIASLAAEPGVYNVGAGSWSLGDVLETVQHVAGCRARIRTEEDRGVDVPATQLDCSRLREATGWEAQTSLADGIRKSWEWLRGRPYRRRD